MDTGAATFVFSGTVLPVSRGSRSTGQVSVRADTVIEGRGLLADLAGQTILVSGGQRLETGQSYVFETVPEKYGESVEVRALKVRPASDSPTAARAAPANSALAERVKSAALIIKGRVTDVQAAPAPSHVSEHTPAWHDAVVRVEHVYAGALADETVTVRFPESSDVRWRDAPRFEVGDRGVFLLQRGAPEGSAKSVFSALNPLDFVPAERGGEIEAMLAAG